MLTACSAALEGTDSEPATIAPSAADINAAAQEPSSSQPSASVAVDPGLSADQSQSDAVKEPQINRRVEVPDDLRVNWLLPWDGIRPIYNPEFTSASHAPLEEDELIIGVAWDGEAKAYYYRDVEAAGVVNDSLGDIPIFLWAAAENFHAYVRQVGVQTLTFRLDGDLLLDEETGSIWDIGRALDAAGPLKGASLQPVPSTSAFDWAWEDFYPGTEFYSDS